MWTDHSHFFARCQIDLETSLSPLDSKATIEAWQDMAMTSSSMTQRARLVAQKTHHLHLVGLRKLFGFLRSSTAHAPQPIRLHPRRVNYNLFPVIISRHPVEVAPCRDGDRYGIVRRRSRSTHATYERQQCRRFNAARTSCSGDTRVTRTINTNCSRAKFCSQHRGTIYLIGYCGLCLVRCRPALH